MTQTWPPSEPTSVQNTILAYPYVQYQGDDNIAAFFRAYNIYAQAYLDWFNALDLPVYTSAPVSGPLLDWVAKGLYGISRPGLPSSFGSPDQGPVNTFNVNSLTANGFVPGLPDTYTATTDDTFRRIITWHFYKGDSKVFTPRWLKRRVNRFLSGLNGGDVHNDQTHGISLYPTGFKAWTIQLTNTPISTIFKIAVDSGVLELPLQITWTVTLV
jgi:hypothetical protein